MRRHPLLALLVLIPVLSLLASCGASGGDEAKTDGTTATTTAGSDDDSSTTVDGSGDDSGGSGERPTSAQLADLLPTVDDIGGDYEQSDEDLSDEADSSDDSGDDSSSDEGSDPTEEAIIEACPGAEILNELDNTSDDNADEVSREFSTPADATIEVALDPTPDQFDEDTVDQVVEALSDCGKITTEDEDGNAIEMEISAEKTDEYGDFGVSMKMNASFSLMGMTIPIDFEGLIFSVDGTTVSVVATSGLDDTTFEAVPGDYDKIPDIATLMEDRVASL